MIMTSTVEVLGSFHPLLVHLPIGFILAALILEFLKNRFPGMRISQSLQILWTLGFLAALASGICGLLLAQSNHYTGQGLAIHKWTGIAVVILCLLPVCHYWGVHTIHSQLKNVAIGMMAIVLVVAGHFGAELTHGQSYLTKNMGIFGGDMSQDNDFINFEKTDTVLLYEDIVHPIIEKKCVTCHNTNLARGNFDMSSYSTLSDDTFGENIKKGLPFESEILKRALLPQDHKKFMPPFGQPLNYVETRLIAWWITEGANTGSDIRSIDMPEDVQDILRQYYNINLKKTSFYESLTVEPLPSSTIEALEQANFKVSQLSNDNFLLDVSRTGKSRTLSSEEIESLLLAADHITWLDLGGTDLKDEHMSVIAKLSNLTRLKIPNTAVTDAGLKAITGLSHLQTLNVYNTPVTAAAIDYFVSMKSLKKLYVWQTGLTTAEIETLRRLKGDLDVISGIN